ncbi:MAG: methionine adenosyltransferase [SAR202 cluster bacterium]|jgi:S-adenosylmethionine synthetase|nr:MAG: methionine adenosyltransferase [SAR202 cluster bacterium]KAA1301649.1 MAG: methionine adenosyltransferase [SAR202 cluster bacterium]MEC8987382.1 methionine adenosyltransferase [Chloroflexota bacterium]MEE3345697.1 methionine adenosyltransferase [Chloroflexota bacterium]
MTLNFMESESYLFTSESVTEGHPDKICDQISDGVLDAMLKLDPRARVACEVSCTTGLVIVMGEISISEGYVDIPGLVRNTLKNIGYTDPSYGFDYQSCGVMVAIDEQSSDISAGVSNALETRSSAMSEDEVESLGAGDQGMMVGYACDETPELMPLPMALSHQLTKKLSEVRKSGELKYLRPDGKSQVTVEYSKGIPKRVHTVLLSNQHDPDVENAIIEKDLIEKVAKDIIPHDLLIDTRFIVNPSGRFVIGGPVGDTGLTGRKILVDTYGGMARHGGGAFSGKDPTKVDRSAAYAARWVAKNLVAAGVASRAEVQVSYAIGVSAPISVSVETFGTNKISNQEIDQIVETHFDLRPGAIIRDLDLRRPIYYQTASYGHFGRTDVELPWEQTNKVEDIKKSLNT